jgi:hypothetical protein
MKLQDAVKAYIHKEKQIRELIVWSYGVETYQEMMLETDSPIVSTSHYHYAAYAKQFGGDVWEKALDEYFENQKRNKQ